MDKKEPSTPSWVWSGTVPSLNGLRAFAILAVIASHYNREFAGSWSIGHFGVTSFFVLSGFLITLLLIREHERSGRISLKGFYQRRALRILPAYFTFLGCMAVLTWFGVFSPSALTWITALTYTSCFFTMVIDPHIAHSWSLSVEEHFYLLWPLLFKAARTRTTMWVLGLYILANPFIRWGLYRLDMPVFDMNYSTPGQMGSIATGCLLAFIVTGGFLKRCRDFIQRRPQTVVALGLLIVGLSLIIFRSQKMLHDVVVDPLRAAGFGISLLGILYLPPSHVLTRVLNWTPINWIGVLSYSLYLWQQIFAREYQSIPGGWVVSALLLIAVASASYYWIESPFLRLKEKISGGGGRRPISSRVSVPLEGSFKEPVH